jgi:hypothetical protein
MAEQGKDVNSFLKMLTFRQAQGYAKRRFKRKIMLIRDMTSICAQGSLSQ